MTAETARDGESRDHGQEEQHEHTDAPVEQVKNTFSKVMEVRVYVCVCVCPVPPAVRRVFWRRLMKSFPVETEEILDVSLYSAVFELRAGEHSRRYVPSMRRVCLLRLKEASDKHTVFACSFEWLQAFRTTPFLATAVTLTGLAVLFALISTWAAWCVVFCSDA